MFGTRLAGWRRTVLGVVVATALWPLASAHGQTPPRLTLTTLGTHAGPIPSATRAEPANLVRYGDQNILVDVGDGAASQLAKAGLALGDVQTVFVSHLHFDHTGGLFAFLSLRTMGGYGTPVTIYGPPGTRATVEALTTAMGPGIATFPVGANGAVGAPHFNVVELTDGSSVSVGPLKVTAAENSHFVTFPEERRPVSLAYRFEALGRTIVYTGDTGPSANLERLCRGADLLVSEISDPDLAMRHLRESRPDLPPRALAALEQHFRRQHLSLEEAGRLAKSCGAGALVLTHGSELIEQTPEASAAIARQYGGSISFAKDLDKY